MQKELWLKVLHLKSSVDTYNNGAIDFCLLSTKGEVMINDSPPSPSSFLPEILVLLNGKHPVLHRNIAVFHLADLIKINVLSTGDLDAQSLQFLQIYLPYCFLHLHAKSYKRAVVTAHFAQTLDGKIATNSGHSKWIGNKENLLHAHRMRALSDAILVGSGTIKQDQPSLNVRLVEGKSPRRIILGNSCEDFTSLQSACKSKILVLGKESATAHFSNIEYHKLPAQGDYINAQDVLQFLFSKGIYSVYLEGGPLTTSNFLKDKAVDILQLHVAPILFGSGKQAIHLSEINEVKDSIQFDYSTFLPMGDAIMFMGNLVHELTEQP